MTQAIEIAPDLTCYRADFPLLRRRLNGHPVIYLDSAATALKPQTVIDSVTRYYTDCTANVRRGVHALSEEASDLFEAARERIGRFINADAREILFVRNATEACNLVANSLPSDALVATNFAEHHSNLLPWRARRHIELETDSTGRINVDKAESVLGSSSPAVVTFSSVGNAFGVRQPVFELTELAHASGAKVLLDVSQSIGHEPVDVRMFNCDYLCFSGHKMLGPTGVGVLYVRAGAEDQLHPLLLGGSMVKSVGLDNYTPLEFPWGFEAGTPSIEGVFGLAAACDYLDSIGLSVIHEHTSALTHQLREELQQINRVRVHGNSNDDSAIVTFSVTGLEAHGVARILSNRHAILVRSGFHCAEPLHHIRNLPETVRVSVHLYNTAEEIDTCARAVRMISDLP
jgi:cysteine desulfurase/selenocysteine lyase